MKRTKSAARCWCLVSVGILCLTPQREIVAADSADSSTIRVAIYADAGASRKGSPQVQRCLPAELNFEIKPVTAEDIRGGALNEFDVLIHPGGSGSKQAQTLGEVGRERVREFVKEGGGFIGICAGAYLASANYPWSLNLIDARVVDSEHWARGKGEVQLRLPPAGRVALQIDQELVAIHYNQGPLLAPGDKQELPDYELLAAFETEIAENGAPAGVMKGTTAIARGNLGKGRVVCFSPHPEKTRGRDAFLRAAIQWAAGQPQNADGKTESPPSQPQSGESQ
ncbi:MAG: BPL-N domain-containing protein [Pirellulales bacterium]